MGTNKARRILLSDRYKYPSKLAEPIIAWIFRKSISRGKLRLQFSDETIEIGTGRLICTIAPPSLKRFIWMLLKPDYRLPSHYTYGYWCCEEGKLYDFLNLLTAQTKSPLHWWFRLFNRSPLRDRIIYRLFPLKVKENISIHYNTDPDFMRLILGQHLEYTCAFFDRKGGNLDDAQVRKIHTVIERLQICGSDNVLDMGCGWGQIAEAVSKETGANVTGLNIAPNQISYAQSKKSARTAFVLSDYEAFERTEKFNKIYSIGMLEHIGRGKLDNYFAKIFQFLGKDGRALIHCIVRAKEGSTNSWIDREVFPGAYIPELSEIVKSIDVSCLQLETIFSHDKTNYQRTLTAWTENLYKNWDELQAVLGKRISAADAQLIMRIWEFYLSGSRLAFNDTNGYCYNVQILVKPQKPGSPEHPLLQ